MNIRPFWRGHLFLFGKPQATTYPSKAGLRLLSVFLFLELIVRPLLNVGARWLMIADYDWWPFVKVTILIGLACWLVTKFANVRLSQLGLYSWPRWSSIERVYFPQIMAIAIVIFSYFTFVSLKALWTRRADLLQTAMLIFAAEMIWGFYQEFLYRGLLQTELVRRWGTRTGILVSNCLYTVGPLHAYEFWAAKGNPAHLWIFAAIFSIGLFFAIIFHRSGNLWIIGAMHGLGDWFMDGLPKVLRMPG